ncbi:MAG: hypothetical protein ACP5VR_12650 [Acidimicrobiales bacterium]
MPGVYKSRGWLEPYAATVHHGNWFSRCAAFGYRIWHVLRPLASPDEEDVNREVLSGCQLWAALSEQAVRTAAGTEEARHGVCAGLGLQPDRGTTTVSKEMACLAHKDALGSHHQGPVLLSDRGGPPTYEPPPCSWVRS